MQSHPLQVWNPVKELKGKLGIVKRVGEIKSGIR